MQNSKEAKSSAFCFETENQIGIITINNGSQNRLPEPDFIDLNLLDELVCGQELKGLIITGQGRHFSAGADVDNIKAHRDNPGGLQEALKKGKDVLNYIEALPMVTVAAVSGVCFGGGLEFALSCQFRVGTANAVLAFPESNLGIMPGLAGTIRLPRMIGRKKAVEIILSGRTINAEEAYELGLIDRIVPNKEHLSQAKQFIEELTQNKSIQQIRNIVQSINNSRLLTETEAMDKEGEMFVGLAKNLEGGL